MIAELLMDREANGVPYDRARELTGWVYVDTVPAPADGERFPARSYGSGGYLASDVENSFTGLGGVSVHAIIAPDYDAMTGQGRRALIYRGHGGPTASAYWAWGVEVERSGNNIEVYGVHQDQGGVFRSLLIGSFGVGVEWVLLAVSRETIADEFEWRAWLDGESIGTAVQVSVATATPGQPVTLGARIIAAGSTERSFLGRIERVLVKGRAATGAEVRHEYNALVGAYSDAYDTWSAYAPPFDHSPTSAYGRYRIRPMAEIYALFDASARRQDEALLPPAAYGEHLEAFEQALGITPATTDSIAQRQAATQAALAGVQDLSPSALQSLAALLFGVVDGDVEILEGHNYQEIAVTGAGELTGPPWRVRGPADVTNEVAGLTIHVPAGRDLRHMALNERSVFVELGIHHLLERESDHGLAVTFETTTGLQEDTWTGIAFVGPDDAVWWVGLDAGGLIRREYDVVTGLSTRTVLDGAVSAPVELVVEWTGAAWTLRYRDPGTGPGNWTELDLPAPTTPITWFGVSVSSALPVTLLDVTVEVSAVTAKAGDADSWAEWQAFDTDPVFRDMVGQSVELDRKGRAASHGSATYEPELVADVDGSAWSYTPTQLLGLRVPSIGDTASDAAQSTGVYPGHLWLFQEPAAPVVDRAGTEDLVEVAPAPIYQVTGPVDRFAVEFAVSSNALRATAAGSLDVSGNSLFLGAIMRITGNGVILGKEQTATIGWVLQKSAGNMTLRIGDGILSATATLTDVASGFVVDQWFACTMLVQDAGGGIARVVVATSQGSAQAQASVSTSNTGLFAFGGGQSGSAAIHRQRWATATLGGEADALTPADLAAAAVRLAAASGAA